MEEDSWSFGRYAPSRRYQSALKSQSDYCLEFEEFEGDDDEEVEADYPCPFCYEDYDLISLCCHIDDEHPREAKFGVCPVCTARTNTDMVGHITTHHRHLLKSLHEPKSYRSGLYSMFSSSRKDMGFERFQFGSSAAVASTKAKADPFLSFINNSPSDGRSKHVQLDPPTELDLKKPSADKETVENDAESPPPLSDKDQMEKANRSEFVQELLLSTIFDAVL